MSRPPLAEHPLPRHDGDTDKDSRGSVLVVAGSAPVPGAALLAATAALRVGAGKVQIASAPEHRSALGLHLPEALVLSLDDREALADAAGDNDAVVVGPGLLDDDAELVGLVAPRVRPDAVLVIDAGALGHLPGEIPRHTVLMPNTDEVGELLGVDGEEADAATALARRYGAVATVRGAATWTADPGGHLTCDDTGNVGMATSGSGDVLAGMIGGLAARSGDPLTAVLWAVHVHGLAGEALARRIGPLGFLARELLDELPGLLGQLSASATA
jgi:ADP-dependent NAD(P)H-hydrate dehydratase